MSEAVTPTPAADAPDRLGDTVTVLIALVGILGTIIAWRLGDAGTAAADATREAIRARERLGAAEVSAGIGTLDGWAAWLDYGTARLRADGLADAGDARGSHAASGEAAGHWMSVPAAYLDPAGGYDVVAHQAALAVEAARDVPSVDERLAAAVAAEATGQALGRAGLVLAAALPFLTAAEIVRHRRLRLVLAAGGAIMLAAGLVLVAAAWA